MRGDDVGDIDVSIAGFSPHAARGGARISISLILIFISNVINDKGLLCCMHYILVGPPQELSDRQILAQSDGIIH